MNYKIFGFLITIMAILPFEGNALDSLRVEQINDAQYIIHQVDKGETLYSLSRRYDVSLDEMIEINAIIDNQLSLGQELRIPLGKNEEVDLSGQAEEAILDDSTSIHEVVQGETLYAISKSYGVALEDIRSLNGLASNEISIGQMLRIPGTIEQPAVSIVLDEEEKEEVEKETKEEDQIPEGFTEYLVQTGESLESIASRFSVRPDSIVYWNRLPNSYLTIGQRLIVKGELDQEKLLVKEEVEILPYGTRKQIKDNSGFTKILEEGSARKIDTSTKTTKYLALHRTLSVGSLVEVRNLMNNQKIFVRVVGKLPETGLNKNVMIRLSPICFERLGVIDPKTRVEVSYYLD
ncbi:MAG: LysM peptidoglycan-binding domain-containing protein [Cyclobacteriaceae bacterium]